MILQMYTVYDSKGEAFINPFFLHNEQMAIRSFTDCVNDKDHIFGLHPEDYTLFHIGEYDNSTGKILPLKVQRSICLGTTLVIQDIKEEKKDE